MIGLNEYAEKYGIDVALLTSREMKTEVVTARQIYWLYMKSLGFGYREIARQFGYSPAGILVGVRRIKDLMGSKDAYVRFRCEVVGLNVEELSKVNI